ncbi:MAG: translation initiation factor IF-3 [Chloroflexia bacterium]
MRWPTLIFTQSRRKDITRDFRVNGRIRAREVRLIGDGGENTLMFTRDAIALAQQRGLDLVEVAPNENPPVCKLMDYGKFKYDQTKKERDARKTQHQVILKEVRLSPKIDDHDVEYRTKMVRRFLDEGNKVKLTVKFKGRELAHTNLGRDVLDQVRLSLGDNVIIESPPKMEGKSMIMILAPRPAKGAARPAQPRPQPAQAPPTPAPATGEAVAAPKPAVAAPVATPAPVPAPVAATATAEPAVARPAR